MVAHLEIPKDKLTEFCRRHQIRKLSFFGSVLRNDFRPDSDVDVLVEFAPEAVVGYFKMDVIENELSAFLGGHKIDFVNPKFINRRIKRNVLQSAEVQYAEG